MTVGAFTLEIGTAGFEECAETLLSYAFKAEYPYPMLMTWAEYRMQEFKKTFYTENDGQWPDDDDMTRANKARAGLSLQTMRASDALFNSLTQKGSDHQILEVGPNTVVLGTDLGYAQAVGEGDPAHNTPPRPFMTNPEEHIAVAASMLKTWIFGRHLLNQAKASNAALEAMDPWT